VADSNAASQGGKHRERHQDKRAVAVDDIEAAEAVECRANGCVMAVGSGMLDCVGVVVEFDGEIWGQGGISET
jgi:hypothetical protein